jgi:trans-2-enoyl-CoA reductase
VAASAAADASALAAAAVGPLVAAKRMLEDFVALKAGDAVAQSGADSLTGQAVVQLAAARDRV